MTDNNTFYKYFVVENKEEYCSKHLKIINVILGDDFLTGLEIDVISYLYSLGVDDEAMYIVSFREAVRARFKFSSASYTNFKRRLNKKGFLSKNGKLLSDLLPKTSTDQSYFFLIKEKPNV